MSIEVRHLEPGDWGPLAAVLARDPGNLIHASPPFLDFLTRTTGAPVTVLLAEDGGSPLGALPFLTLTRPGVGTVVNSLPWFGSHGGCCVDRADPRSGTVRRTLLERFVAETSAPDILSSALVLLPDEMPFLDDYRAALRPDVEDPRRGQWTTLPVEEADVLLATFGQKTRNIVRKSLRQGFSERVTDEDWAWGFLSRIHADNMAAVGALAKPAAHFAALRRALPSSVRRLSVACLDGTPVAALLLLFHGDTVEYLVPAIVPAYRPLQPLSFLILEGMRAAVERGSRLWNWGGTGFGQSALHHFKAGFGAVDRPYCYLIRSGPEGRERLCRHREALPALFPFFYCYPYDRLVP